MIRPGSRTNTAKPGKQQGPRAGKDRASPKLLRLVLTAAVAVALAVVFIKMIIPGPDDRSRRPDTVKPVIPEKTAESPPISSGEDGTVTGTDIDETARTYQGQGGQPADDPVDTWDITLTISGRTFLLLEGAVVAREFAGDPPITDFSFSVTSDRYEIGLSESGTPAFQINNSYDPATAVPFSIDENGQFQIYLTPRKLSLDPKTIPTRFLTKRENSPLISMQGFIRPDDTVIGTFHSIFAQDVEYVLYPFTE